MCVPFSQCGAVVTEQTKKQLRPQIILGQMRWLCLQRKSLPTTKENPLQCYSWFDSWYFGVSDPAGNSEVAGPLAARGHGRAATADSTSEHLVPGPANLSNLQPLFAPGPEVALGASRQLQRDSSRRRSDCRQVPGISQLGGYRRAPRRCCAEVPLLLCFLEPRLPG